VQQRGFSSQRHDVDEGAVEPVLVGNRAVYTTHSETINIAMAAAMMSSGRYDGVSFRGHSMKSTLSHFMKRALRTEGGQHGVIDTCYWTSANVLGSEGRRYSGHRGGRMNFKREKGVPENLRLVSAFILPREIREGLRLEAGYVDLDIRMCHLAAFAMRHHVVDGPIAKLLGPEGADFKRTLEECAFAKIHGTRAASKIPIMLLNGGALPPGCPLWLDELQLQIESLHIADAKQVNAKPGSKTAYRKAYFLNEAVERMWLDSLESISEAHRVKVVGYEHDGLPLERCSDVTVAAIIADAASKGIVVVSKKHPETYDEWCLAWGVDDFPRLSEELVAEVLDDPLRRALVSTEPPIDHDAWTCVMLDCFSQSEFPEFVKNREDSETIVIEYWDDSKLKWIPAGGGRAIRDRFASSLRRYIERQSPGDGIGALAGNSGFQNPIIEALKVKLPCATDPLIGVLHGDSTRGLLRFDDGMVVDFNLAKVFPCRPCHRIGFSTKCNWKAFSGGGDERGAIESVITAFEVHITSGGQSVKGTSTQAMLTDMRTARPGSLYAVFWGIFEDDDVAIWVLRQCCRGLAGLEILEEFILFYDERGQNGKGTILTLLRLALGDYYTTCVYKALSESPAGNNDRLAKCQGKRVISCNEAFNKKDANLEFDATIIKTLIGLDDPIETMAKYKAPVEWRGQALLIISSNMLPSFPSDDGGLSTRLSLLRFPFTFVQRPTGDMNDDMNDDDDIDIPAQPEEPGARWQDPEIKLKGMGALVPEFFCWAIGFNALLVKQEKTGRVLLPRPAKIEVETCELFQTGGGVDAGDSESAADCDLAHLLRDFDQMHLTEVPVDTNSTKGATPSTCNQVEVKVLEYIHARGFTAVKKEAVVALMRRVYIMTLPVTQKTFRVNKTTVRSFYRHVDHGSGASRIFRSALLLKGSVAASLASASSGAA